MIYKRTFPAFFFPFCSGNHFVKMFVSMNKYCLATNISLFFLFIFLHKNYFCELHLITYHVKIILLQFGKEKFMILSADFYHTLKFYRKQHTYIIKISLMFLFDGTSLFLVPFSSLFIYQKRFFFFLH